MKRDQDEIDFSRHVWSALPVAVLLPVVAVLAYGMRVLVPWPRFSALAMFVLLATAFLATFVALMRRRLPRAGVLAACHLLTWVPYIAVETIIAVREGIVPEPTRRFLGAGAQAVASGFGGLVFLALGTCVGVLLARRSADRLLRIIAIPTVAFAAIAAVSGLGSAALRPDPDSYVASLRQVTELGAGGSLHVGRTELVYDRRQVPDTLPLISFEEPKMHAECIIWGMAENPKSWPDLAPCPRIRVLVDDTADVALIEGFNGGYIAFHPSDGTAAGLTMETAKGKIAPPIGWSVGSAIGALLGLAFLVKARRLRRRANEVMGVEAKHRGRGLVELANGEVTRVLAAEDLPNGYVVLGEHNEEMPTYRNVGGPRFGAAWAGKLADLRAGRLDLAASLETIAFASSVLGVAPLVVVRVLTWF